MLLAVAADPRARARHQQRFVVVDRRRAAPSASPHAAAGAEDARESLPARCCGRRTAADVVDVVNLVIATWLTEGCLTVIRTDRK